MSAIGVKLLLAGMFYTLGWTFITQGSNVGFSDEIDNIRAPMPDIDDPKYDGIFGTNHLDYLFDWLGTVGSKVGSVFAAVWQLFITPEITFYGETLNLTGTFTVINTAFLGMFAFGLWDGMISRLAGMV